MRLLGIVRLAGRTERKIVNPGHFHHVCSEAMTMIRLSGWAPGLRKISLTKLLQEEVGLGVKEANAMVDDVLEGHHVVVTLQPGQDASAVAASMLKLGAICEVQDDE